MFKESFDIPYQDYQPKNKVDIEDQVIDSEEVEKEIEADVEANQEEENLIVDEELLEDIVE